MDTPTPGRMDFFPYLAAGAGLFFGLIISMAARAEPPDTETLAELTELVREGQQPAHVDVLIAELREARQAAALTDQAHAELLEAAMEVAPERVVAELAKGVDMDLLAHAPVADQRLWLNESTRQLRIGQRRAMRTAKKARRYQDEPGTRCALRRAERLGTLRDLDEASREDWQLAREGGDTAEMEHALARISVLRDLGWRHVAALQACAVRRPEPATAEDFPVCQEDFEEPTFDWYTGFYVPESEGCTPPI